MHKSGYTNAMTIDDALSNIKSNDSVSFQWYPVRGANGCLFELGGRNHNNKLEVSAYIPIYVNGKMQIMPNGYVNNAYRIDEEFIEFPDFRLNLPKKFDLIEFLRKNDIRSPLKFVETSRKVVSYEACYELTDKRFKKRK